MFLMTESGFLLFFYCDGSLNENEKCLWVSGIHFATKISKHKTKNTKWQIEGIMSMPCDKSFIDQTSSRVIFMWINGDLQATDLYKLKSKMLYCMTTFTKCFGVSIGNVVFTTFHNLHQLFCKAVRLQFPFQFLPAVFAWWWPIW